MAEQEEGWPLGLQPINARVGGINRYFSGPISFNTSPTCSSTDSSSDLDTQSTGSFFHDKSITLGSLIGVHDIQLSRRSLDRTKIEPSKQNTKESNTWCFSWCASNSSFTVGTKTGPSLGHFLELERKAAASQLSPTICGVNEFFLAQPISEPNSLFVNGLVAPPSSNSSSATGKKRRGTARRDQLIIGGCEICLPFSSCISWRRHSFSH